jgi:hypothetical protein
VASAEASGSLAAFAALATGPAPDVHERTLALARELAMLRSRARWRRWLGWLLGPDPSEAVDDALAAAGLGVPALR